MLLVVVVREGVVGVLLAWLVCAVLVGAVEVVLVVVEVLEVMESVVVPSALLPMITTGVGGATGTTEMSTLVVLLRPSSSVARAVSV